MELRFRLYQLLVDILKQLVGAVSEGIMNRLINRVIGIALRAVHVRDRMARGAGNSSLRRGMPDIIEVWIIKSAAKERHHIMTTGAPSRGLHTPIPFQ